jgi:hypothetical protein
MMLPIPRRAEACRDFRVLVVRKAIFAIDTVQRWRHHVYEFDHNPSCILRISRSRSAEELTLSDGSVVRRGDPLIEIHFWNERVPQMAPGGPDLAWGVRFHRCLSRSLAYLADYVSESAKLHDVVAFRAETSFPTLPGLEHYARFYGRYGFDFRRIPCDALGGRVPLLSMNLYVWTIIWVLNPASVRGRSAATAQRAELWLSRSMLLNRHGNGVCRGHSSRVPTAERKRTCDEPETTSP